LSRLAATLLVLPLSAAVIGAIILGVVGIVQLKLYGFVLLIIALATIRPVLALAQMVWTGRSPAWFEEQDLNEEEIRDLRRKYE
jgi:hypothetical protein